MHRRRTLTPALLALLLLPRAAEADETDYLPDNPEWNGCAELAHLAAGMQLRLELLEEIDWSHLPAQATLLVLYPTVELNPRDFVSFLSGGGRLLIADDFGRSDPLLGALGIRRLAGRQVTGAPLHNANPNLPIARAGPATHALGEGVTDVISNHPAFFRSDFPTLVGFSPDQQLLVAGKLGEGRFVALADPSVLINAMLRFEGNATLARNVLHYLRPRLEDDRIFVVTRHFRTRGQPGKGSRAPSGGVQKFLADYSKFLGRLNDFAPTQPAFRALGVVSGFLGLVVLGLLLPLPRRELSGHWLRPEGRVATPDQRSLFAAEQQRQSAAFGAAVLREEIEELLTDVLEAPGPVFTIHPKWVVHRVRERAGDEAARVCSRLLASMKNVSQTVSLGGIASLAAIRRGDLATMYDHSRRLLKLLGRDPLPEVSSRNRTHG